MTNNEKELLALCDLVLEKDSRGSYGKIYAGPLLQAPKAERIVATELKRRIEQPSEREKELIGAAQEFVAKAERGEARSKLSYARFKVALAAYDKGEKE